MVKKGKWTVPGKLNIVEHGFGTECDARRLQGEIR